MLDSKFFPLVAGIAAAITISVLAYLEAFTGQGLWLMAPFGASTVLVFGLPKSPLAQPKNVFFGHVLSALVGVVFVTFVGVEPWSLGAATGVAIALMLATGTTHPPAGANPALIMLTGQSWGFLLTPVAAGAVVIIAMGFLVNKFVHKQ